MQRRNWSMNVYEYFPKRPQSVRRSTLEEMRNHGWIKIGLIPTEGSYGWVITDKGQALVTHGTKQ